jgi:roadblock/LC7 domain-containing protein
MTTWGNIYGSNAGLLLAGMLVLFIPGAQLGAQILGFNGQAIGWTTLNPAEPFQAQAGLRYIPELNFSLPAGAYSVDGEFSVNLWGSAIYSQDSTDLDGDISPYRMWVKFSGDQFELRAGLQKINFGSAQLFRPLMWFDRIDPRDPLQLTDGVWALLGRYYFLNNANIWLWGIYGDDKVKGWELIPSKKNSIEYGGRVQLPLYTGEIAATYHHRTADPEPVLPDSITLGETSPENRIGLDLKMDLAVGIWAEAVLSRQNFSYTDLNYNSMLNVGMDYTFGLGNGLNVMTEGFAYLQGEKPFVSEEGLWFGLLSANYPVNIIHNVSAMFFYDFSNKNFYRFINWTMAYDKWSFYIMGFWNPETYTLYNVDPRTSLYGGWGFQLMAVFNH